METHRRIVVGTALIAALFASSVRAATLDEVWRRKYADHLPLFCKYTQRLPDHVTYGDYFSDRSQNYYKKVFGERNWLHVHHYCFGLDMMYEAGKMVDDAKRVSTYGYAIKEYDYVLQRADDTLPILHEIYLQKGLAFMAIGKLVEAVEQFSMAIDRRPDFVPAYLALSSCFEQYGDSDRALSVIETGLRHVPDSASLKSREAHLREAMGSSRGGASGEGG